MRLDKLVPSTRDRSIRTDSDSSLSNITQMNTIIDSLISLLDEIKTKRLRLSRSNRDFKKPFISTWDTRNTNALSTADNQIKLPLLESGQYFFRVSWGDGKHDVIRSYDDPATTHTYATAGEYTIRIKGICEGWNFNYDNDRDTGGIDRLKLLSVSSWGNLKITTSSCFLGCYNLDLATVDDVLDISGTTDLRGMFQDCPGLTGINNIEYWDVSHVTRFVAMFEQTYSGPNYTFNADFSLWDVSKGGDFRYMFRNCRALNFDASAWHLKSATLLNGMFNNCVGFSTENYDKLLIGWAAKDVLPADKNFGGPPVQYTSAALDARNILLNTWGWSISDGGLQP